MGSRPGKPRLLLMLSAGGLALMLGLAWMQMAGVRSLGAEQAIPDTPLRVQPPRGWRVHPKDPRVFVLVAQGRGERSIRFDYRQLPEFHPPEQALETLGLADRRGIVDKIATRVGAYPAVEFHLRRLVRKGWQYQLHEQLIRLASLPNGDVITVEYTPLKEGTLRPADLAFMEDVCATVRLDDPNLTREPAEIMQHAGIEIPVEPDWRLMPARLPEVAGLHLGGREDGLPTWSISLFQTWVSPARTAEVILADVATKEWLAFDDPGPAIETQVSGSRRISSMTHPKLGLINHPMPAAWIVEEDGRAAILFVHAAPTTAKAANENASRIARELTLAPTEAIPDMPAAMGVGEELVDNLHRYGAQPRWGSQPSTFLYGGQRLARRGGTWGTREERQEMRRVPLNGDPSRGYQGRTTLHEITPGPRNRRIVAKPYQIEKWTVDGEARGYTSDVEYAWEGFEAFLHDEWDGTGSTALRTIELSRGRTPQGWRIRFTPGPRFVPPAAELVAAGWVARGEHGDALLEGATLLGRGTHGLLLRQLPGGEGRSRVLLQRDYDPSGNILVFDDLEPVLLIDRTPTAEYRLITPPGDESERNN